MKRPELLAPAGSFEKLVTAIHYGADAVYLGIGELSLRAKADNFDEEGLSEAIAYAKRHMVKTYVTINIFPHNKDMKIIEDHLRGLLLNPPDGIIVSDPGVFDLVKRLIESVPVHISTQANTVNSGSARFWERLGASRIVVGRETTLKEIKEIRDAVSIELEAFVHGSICISYSGRCYISSFLAGRSANRGECTNSCRWSYTLMEEKRPSLYMPVYEDDRGTYILSPKDLCMIDHVDKFSAAGVDSLKIEGRTKGINYVASTVKAYRHAIDNNLSIDLRRELEMSSNRGFTTGMYLGPHPNGDYNHDAGSVYRATHELVGVIREVRRDSAVVMLRNKLRIGDGIEIISTGPNNLSYEVTRMRDMEDTEVELAKNGNTVIINIPALPKVNDLIRRIIA